MRTQLAAGAVFLLAVPFLGFGQAQEVKPGGGVELVKRTVMAVNYQHRSGSTKIDFQGTQLLPGGRGEAKVESKRGYLEIEAEFEGLQPARNFGNEYLTYVLWAITAEGRPENLGEVILRGNKSELKVTTQLQAFGLVVTAEPYFAVTFPSDIVVLENTRRRDTRGRVDEIEARYELLKRGQYMSNEKPDELTAKLMVVDEKVPLQLYQARNAIRIARWTGAEKYAPEIFEKAVGQLIEAEKYQARRRPEEKAAAMMARQAVQTAEDARLLTVRRAEEERIAMERKAAAEREAAARAKAEAEAKLRAQAEQQRVEAEKATAEAMLKRQEAERLTREAEAQRAAALAEVRRIQLQTEQEMAKLEAARAAAMAAVQKADARGAEAAKRAEAEAAMRAKAEADRQQAELLARQAETRRAEALAEIERLQQQTRQELAKLEAARAEALAQKSAAEEAAAKSEQARMELRQRLQTQLNKVLETNNTARGLIVNMSDVVFDTAKFTLRPEAREKLARISGILSMQQDLKVEVEGHTDNVGGDAYNQRLSEQRADAVRRFLIEQGIEESAITSRGFGESRPKATNETAAGRQQNRRVELVVSGELIQTNSGATESR